jgi:hypothetical protein
VRILLRSKVVPLFVTSSTMFSDRALTGPLD